MSIVVCAASRVEARACAKGVRDAGLSEAFEILETGVGLTRARDALERRLATGTRPQMVVSSGFAGAYSADLPLHSWVTSDEVVLLRDGAEVESRRLVPCVAGESMVCRMITSAELVTEHRTVPTSGKPVSVDMETAALAEICEREGVAFAVLRMITDTPQEPLPGFLVFFAAAMAETDSRARARMGFAGLRGALKDPAAVLRLARDSGAWIDALRGGWEKSAESVRNHCGKPPSVATIQR